MRKLKLRTAALLGAAMLAIGACGSAAAPAAGGDPAGSVTAAFNSAESAGFATMVNFVCAAQKEDLTSLFGVGGMDQIIGAGIDANELFSTLKMDFTDLKATEKSRDGNTAVVQVTGKASFQVDEAKFKEIMRKVLESQGQTVTDSQLDQIIAAMAGSLATTQDINEEVTVVNEGGKWLICE